MDITKLFEYHHAFSRNYDTPTWGFKEHEEAAAFLRTLNPSYLDPDIATAIMSYIELEARQRLKEKRAAVSRAAFDAGKIKELNITVDTEGATYLVPTALWREAEKWKDAHSSPMPTIEIAKFLDYKGQIEKIPAKQPSELKKLRTENDALSRRIAALENMQIWYARLEDQKRQLREFEALVDSYTKNRL